MGVRDVPQAAPDRGPRSFQRRVLADLQALETMLDGGLVESGVRRIGAEQELFLIDRKGFAAPAAAAIIERLDDPRFCPELALFNLEIDLSPLLLGGTCLSAMAGALRELIERVRAAGAPDVEPVLAGILPTLRHADLVASNITPLPRFLDIDRAVAALTPGPFQIHIRGIDDLRLSRGSLIVEASNGSFQVHLQTSPAEFALLYNAAQALAAPTLAAATNAPLLLGKRLWHETRIALFQQATDVRGSEPERTAVPRVTFGRAWVERSVLEIYREDVLRFRPLLDLDDDEDPLEVLARGGVPRLAALALHNGTIWRWNRPCYGVTDGRPHLRIENRVFPAGPTIDDEIANAALWLGLMRTTIDREVNVARRLDFEAARANFIAAARLGLDAQFRWIDGRSVPADRLILDDLLPAAYDGLRTAGVDAADADRFLGIISRRVATRRTGSRWQLDSLAAMEGGARRTSLPERLAALVRAMRRGQREGAPIHAWPLARIDEPGESAQAEATVGQYMTSDVFTLRPEDPVEMAAHLMVWRGVRHVPVEDEHNRLLGVVSYRSILRLVARAGLDGVERSLPVGRIMHPAPRTTTPDAPVAEAIETMARTGVSFLPVVRGGRLVGVFSERDLFGVARETLLARLSETGRLPRPPKPRRRRPSHAAVD